MHPHNGNSKRIPDVVSRMTEINDDELPDLVLTSRGISHKFLVRIKRDDGDERVNDQYTGQDRKLDSTRRERCCGRDTASIRLVRGLAFDGFLHGIHLAPFICQAVEFSREAFDSFSPVLTWFEGNDTVNWDARGRVLGEVGVGENPVHVGFHGTTENALRAKLADQLVASKGAKADEGLKSRDC